ncbi:MAG: YwaF family protein [Spirochaetes bacterium]|nr:YwaF family protein [Spirochaetota bacterium]
MTENFQRPAVQYPVAMFSLPHILFLMCVPLAAFLGIYIARKAGFSIKVLWTCAIIGLLCEFEKILFFAQETAEGGRRMAAEQIPFNMCPFQVILLLVLVMSGNPRKHENILSYMFPTAISGGFMGILVATAIENYHGLLEISTYRYFFYHALLVFLGFYLYHSKPIHFGIKNWLIAILGALLWLTAGIWLNGFFGWDPSVNFNFAVRPPAAGLPFLNLNNGWPAYIVALVTLGFTLITLCYLPVIAREVRAIAGGGKKPAV